MVRTNEEALCGPIGSLSACHAILTDVGWQGAQSALIGRSAELDRLTAVLDAAAGGLAGVALLGGDAGIGKTRLVTELAEQAGGGFAVLFGQCAELGDALPLPPLADALRGASRRAAGGARRAAGARPAAARRHRLGQAAGPGPSSSSSARCSGCWRVQPVLLVLEDLHWADRHP